MDALTELARVCDETYLEWAPPGWTVPVAPPRLGGSLPRGRRVGDARSGRVRRAARSRRSRSAGALDPASAHVGLVFVHPSRWRQGIAARRCALAEGGDAPRAATRASSCGRRRARRPSGSTPRAGWRRDGRREWHPWVGLEIVGYAQGAASEGPAGRLRRSGARVPGASRWARSWSRAGTTWGSRRGSAGASRRGGRDGLRARARVPGLPDARAAAEAVRGGGAGGAGRRASSCARSRPTSRSRTSSRAAPALAAELEGVPVATLVPHVHPDLPPGFPPFSIGARLPRTRSARALWRQTDRLVAVGLEQGRGEYNDCRGAARAGAAAVGAHRALALADDGGDAAAARVSAGVAVVVRVVGPLLWEPGGPAVTRAAGRRRRSYSSRPRRRRTRRTAAARGLEGLADEPVRVIAIGGRRTVPRPPTRSLVAVDVLRARRCRGATS